MGTILRGYISSHDAKGATLTHRERRPPFAVFTGAG